MSGWLAERNRRRNLACRGRSALSLRQAHDVYEDAARRDDDNTEEDRAKHRERTKSAIKRARTRLMHDRVIGCHDPFIWWSGRPVRGIKETQKNDPALFDWPAASRAL
jgi:hypothetical protein